MAKTCGEADAQEPKIAIRGLLRFLFVSLNPKLETPVEFSCVERFL